ncbi:UNVERIFIED_CONTAM: hypothetical protein Sradi_6178800 [Sesamum radiatum]|uniref:RNase H type-1 domain-containing protein n=1 Tax=Sesamum radiatum TaxID=300843 RepID=A0AAW2K8H3_SESRA
MIVGGLAGGDSHHVRISQVREAHDVSLREVLDVEAMEDTPLIQFGRAEQSGPRTSHNDALVITALLANYEVGRIFIDSGSSADILFGEAYDQMQLGDISLGKVNTSLYGFAGEVVHPRGVVSLALTMGAGITRKTYMLKFLVVDVPSAYNVILGRPTLNAFQAVISTYQMKIKFPTPGGVGEVQSDHLQSRKWYVEAVRRGQKRTSDEAHKRVPTSKRGKEACAEEAPEGTGTPSKVQPAEELLNIEIIPGHPDETTRIGSRMREETKEEIVLCLQRNADIFAWTPQDLEGIDPKVITHYLNIDPSLKIVKQKKRYFGPKKDKIIRAEVDICSYTGIVITSPQGEDLEFAIKFGFKASNNEAEYETRVIGMRMAHEAGGKHLLAYSDSQLIVKQVEGAYKAKEENMIQYLQRIKELKFSFDHFQIIQIPQEENIIIDCLSKLASALEDCRTKHITIQYLTEARAPLAAQLITSGEDWRTPIIRWLEEGHLPDNRWEASRHEPLVSYFKGALSTKDLIHTLYFGVCPKKKESTFSKKYIADIVEHMQAHASWPIKPCEQDTSCQL